MLLGGNSSDFSARIGKLRCCRREQLRLQRQTRQVPVSFGGNSSDFSARLQAPVSLGGNSSDFSARLGRLRCRSEGTARTSAPDSASSGVARREQLRLQQQTRQDPVSREIRIPSRANHTVRLLCSRCFRRKTTRDVPVNSGIIAPLREGRLKVRAPLGS